MRNQDWDKQVVERWSTMTDETGKKRRVVSKWHYGSYPAMFALANEHNEVVQWLEGQGATGHKELLNLENPDASFGDQVSFARKKCIDIGGRLF